MIASMRSFRQDASVLKEKGKAQNLAYACYDSLVRTQDFSLSF